MNSKLSLLLLSLALAIAFQFCGSESGDPIVYNDKIVGEQTKIVSKMLELTQTFQSSDAGLMDQKLSEMMTQIKESLKIVKSMDGFDGDTELRDAAIELFKFYESIIGKEFSEMIEILKKGDNITEDDYNRMMEMQESISIREQPLDAKMSEAQSNFSKKHNISMENNPVQKEIDNM